MPLFKITLGNVTVYGAENVVVLVIVWLANDVANMNCAALDAHVYALPLYCKYVPAVGADAGSANV